MQIIKLLGKKWVIGLWWQPLVSSPRKQVKDLGGQDGKTSYNTFTALRGRKQIGVGQTDSIKTDAGFPSLAGALARVFDRHGNILALFRLDGGNSWLFALKDGQILPSGDFYGEDNEVRDQFRRYSQSDIWRQVIETAGTEETEEKLRECLGALTKKIPRIQSVSRGFWLHMAISQMRARPKTTVAATAAVIALVVTFLGLHQHMAYQNRLAQQRQLEQKRAELQDKLRQQGLSAEEMQNALFPQNWKQKPDPMEIIHGCYAQFENEPYQLQGWTLAQIACGPEKTKIIRERSSWASFTTLPADARFQVKAPNKAVSVTKNAHGKRQARAIIGKESVSANMYELAGILNSPIELTWEKPEPREVPEPERKKNRDLPKKFPSPYWTGTFHLKEVPATFMRGAFGLNKIPGLAVGKVQKKDSSWSIEGEMYAK